MTVKDLPLPICQKLQGLDSHTEIFCAVLESHPPEPDPTLLTRAINTYCQSVGLYPWGNPQRADQTVFDIAVMPEVNHALAARVLILALRKDLAQRQIVLEKSVAEDLVKRFLDSFSPKARFFTNFDNVEALVSHYEQDPPPGNESIGCGVYSALSKENHCEGVYVIEPPNRAGWLFVADLD